MAEPIDKDARGPVNLRIKFRSESLQQFIERYGVDVSRGGIFIRTREPLPVGTRLKLDFQLVDTAPLFQGDGTVVWIREHDPSRAGVTPGMGVRFDRLSSESQTTLDTILEEKIRLQQAGVAPGSIAKAGAGMAVRRPSGAFATIDSQGARPPGAPPPLPVEVKMETPSAPSPGAAPVAAMPVSGSRSGQHSTGSSSIFTRPRTTSGLRTVPVPSALFEAPTAADIDKALSVLEEKGGPAPGLPVVPTVIKPETSQALGEDEPTKVFDSTASQEFSASEAVTGPAEVLPDSGVPLAAGDGADGDLTQRRHVDPDDGQVKVDRGGNGRIDGLAATMMGTAPPPIPGANPAALDTPLSSLVDSGKAPAAKLPPPVPMKPAAPATAPAKPGVPVRITTDRPAATESGRFRSDTRYKRRRSKAPVYILAVLVVGAGIGTAGFYIKRERDRRAAAAIAAAAAAPPFAAGQNVTPPAAAGGPTAPPETAGAGTVEPEKTQAAKPEETGTKAAAQAEPQVEKPTKPETKDVGKPEEKSAATEKTARGGRGQREREEEDKPSGKSRRRERGSSTAAAETAKAATGKPEEAATEKRGEEGAKAAGDSGKSTEAAKSGEASKPAEGGKTAEGEKAGETAKAAETATPTLTERPVLKITSSPAGAEVVIDGVPVGTTPFSSKDVSADGTHAISVKKEGYESHERMISGSDWAKGKGGAQSLKFNVKLKRVGGEKPPAEAGEKKEKPPEVEILTPSEP
jgi:uncharacterized protein (TIGR02266 family)